MPWGYGDTHHIHYPEGQTENRVRGIQNRLGINYLEFIRRVDAAMGALNTDDALVSQLTYDTTNDHIKQGGRTNKVWQRSAEYTPGRPQLGEPGRGYFLPLYHYEIDLGFTDRGLMHMGVEQFTEELRDTVQAIARGRRADVLDRLFNDDEVPLNDDGDGASPGFAGSGAGTNVFVGRLPDGSTTDPSYTHYFQMADDDIAIDTALNLMLEAIHNFHPGPVDLLPSATAFDRITSLTADDTQFVSAGSNLVRPAEDRDQALVDPNVYAGVYAGWIRVKFPDAQIDGDNFAIYKSYGSKNQRNPLAWLYDPLYGKEAYVDDRRLTPLTEAMILQAYGIGAGNRTGAVLGSIGGDAGVYSPPSLIR